MENGAMKAGRNDSENNQPHFEGKTCPECGRNKLHFRNFQKSGDKVVEVQYIQRLDDSYSIVIA